jgi:murein DD-endopeptidase MepM/ murein hydrolase activator NlpD
MIFRLLSRLSYRPVLGGTLLLSLSGGAIAPPATADIFSREASAVCPVPALSRLRRHRIAPGETLESIARQYDLIPATLMGMNPSLGGGVAPVGEEIVIPPYNGIRVEVGPGQTWQEIARLYGARADVIFEVNGCDRNPEVVFVPGVNWTPGGTATPAPALLSGSPLPIATTVEFRYGWQLHPGTEQVVFHGGIDLAAAVGTPVLAAAEGVVAFAGFREGYGNVVVVNHARGKQTRYAHLSEIAVRAGQILASGERLGAVGQTGSPDSDRPHLHFEIRYNSDLGWVAEDPDPYLDLGNSDRWYSRGTRQQ